MPASKKTKKNHDKKSIRRNRVNRLKSLIVFAAIVLLFTSVILNFMLVFKVLKLEGQIDKIYSQCNTEMAQQFLRM